MVINRLYQSGIRLLLFLFSATIILPFLYIISVSFTDPSVYVQHTLKLWPEKWSLEAYRYILAGGGFSIALKASLFITLIGTPLALIVSSSFSYMLSQKQLPGRDVILGLVVFTILFSPGLIPNYLLMRSLGLLNSWWSIILPVMSNAWTLLVMKSFYGSIPKELEESATMDGCNELQTYWKIIIPLSKAPLAAFGLFFAVAYWNTYFNAILYINDAAKWPLQVFLQQTVMASNLSAFVNSEAATVAEMMTTVPTETLQMAVIIFVTLPILLVYPFLQKHFVKGVMLGSIKG